MSCRSLRIRLQMRNRHAALLAAAGANTLVMRVGGDSQELIPQIHLGSRTTQRQACLALFLLWHEAFWTQQCQDAKITLRVPWRSDRIFPGEVISGQWSCCVTRFRRWRRFEVKSGSCQREWVRAVLLRTRAVWRRRGTRQRGSPRARGPVCGTESAAGWSNQR